MLVSNLSNTLLVLSMKSNNWHKHRAVQTRSPDETGLSIRRHAGGGLLLRARGHAMGAAAWGPACQLLRGSQIQRKKTARVRT